MKIKESANLNRHVATRYVPKNTWHLNISQVVSVFQLESKTDISYDIHWSEKMDDLKRVSLKQEVFSRKIFEKIK